MDTDIRGILANVFPEGVGNNSNHTDRDFIEDTRQGRRAARRPVKPYISHRDDVDDLFESMDELKRCLNVISTRLKSIL